MEQRRRPDSRHGFQIGMRLEALDRKNPHLIAVATIQDILPNGNLSLYFDGWSHNFDYDCAPGDPDIHPPGYCDHIGHRLDPPHNYGKPFDWQTYLEEQNALPPLHSLFNDEQTQGCPPLLDHLFYPHHKHAPPLTDFSQKDKTSNVALVVEGRKLYVSKEYLAAWSPVFHAMFFEQYLEKDKQEVDLPGKNYDDFVEFLHAIYPSQIPVTDSNVCSLLELAMEYEIGPLVAKCEEYLVATRLASITLNDDAGAAAAVVRQKMSLCERLVLAHRLRCFDLYRRLIRLSFTQINGKEFKTLANDYDMLPTEIKLDILNHVVEKSLKRTENTD